MAMQYVEGQLRRRGQGSLADRIRDVRREYIHRGHGKDIDFPGTTGKAQEVAPERALPDRLQRIQATFELLTKVREPLPSEREALLAKGFVFLSIEAKSLSVIVAENPDYFWIGESDFIKARFQLRDYTPPAMVVGMNPTQLAIEDSFNESQARQLELIEKYSAQHIEPDSPGAKAIMLPASIYAQADIAYAGERDGEKLFKNFYARALDQSLGQYVTFIGRDEPNYRLDVRSWLADDGRSVVRAVPAVVFLQK